MLFYVRCTLAFNTLFTRLIFLVPVRPPHRIALRNKLLHSICACNVYTHNYTVLVNNDAMFMYAKEKLYYIQQHIYIYTYTIIQISSLWLAKKKLIRTIITAKQFVRTSLEHMRETKFLERWKFNFDKCKIYIDMHAAADAEETNTEETHTMCVCVCLWNFAQRMALCLQYINGVYVCNDSNSWHKFSSY